MTVSLPTRLLVFDHDALGENFLNHMLDPENYEVIKVSSNTFGLLTSRTREPDVIVINLMQPSTDGWMLCHKLRQISQVPILVLAAVSDPKSIARWLDAGPEVPSGEWYKRFPGMIVCGEGELIKTFLLPGQHPKGAALD